jgi:hypothetical protein
VGKYLDIIREAERCAVSAVSAVSQPQAEFNNQSDTLSRIRRLPRILSALEARCPAHVPVARWQQCVEDGRRFLATWGEQAERLGWTSADLCGLFPVPANPHPSFARLSRYDGTGLIWLLEGRPVVALTADTASIRYPTGNILTFRKNSRPALGPLGESLGDLQ